MEVTVSAYGINDAGQVVGYSDTAAGAQPCLYHRPQWRGHDRSRDAGWRVTVTPLASTTPGRWWGVSNTAAGDHHAFITGPNGVGMTDLNSLVSLPGGVVLTDATGINNHGQVAAIGSLIPEPETYAMLLAGLGLLGFIARRRKTA